MQDFYKIYRGSKRYSDPDFKPDSDALYWADMGEDTEFMATKAEPLITWKKASSVYTRHSLFGEDGISVEDVE